MYAARFVQEAAALHHQQQGEGVERAGGPRDECAPPSPPPAQNPRLLTRQLIEALRRDLSKDEAAGAWL